MAFGIEQEITWLQVPVKQVGGVHVLEALEALINDILLVYVLEDVGSDDCVQVRVHEVEHEVNVPIVFCPNYIL